MIGDDPQLRGLTRLEPLVAAVLAAGRELRLGHDAATTPEDLEVPIVHVVSFDDLPPGVCETLPEQPPVYAV